MGKNIDKFFLLMWKNFLLQWRHPKQTIVEILAPILFTSLMVILRSLVHPEEYAASFYTSFENRMPQMTAVRPTIVWSPENYVLGKVMDEAVKEINRRSLSDRSTFRHVALKNSEQLDRYLSSEINFASSMAGVQFDDDLSKIRNLPPHINITFRFPGELRGKKNFTLDLQYTDNWKTNRLFPSNQVDGPREPTLNEGGRPSYYLEGFLTLQQELSFAIIKQLKWEVQGKYFSRASAPIQMQRFPYPKYTEDLLLEALQAFVGLIFMVSFVYTCISTVKVITAEKEKQLKEAMKIMGLPNWLHWTAWFLKIFLFLLITAAIMVLLLKARWYPGTNHTIFTYSDPFVIFVFLMLFICATITFCFAISVFFSKANTAATIAGLAWLLSYFPYTYFYDRYGSISLTQKLLVSLCSNTAMAYGFQLTLAFEGNKEGTFLMLLVVTIKNFISEQQNVLRGSATNTLDSHIKWHNIWKTTSPDDDLKLGYLMIMLAIDTVIYLLIALYVEAVFPGDFGVPKPWYYPFSPSYWCGKPRYIGVDFSLEKPTENEFYEKEPWHLDAGIKIKQLRKVFPKNKVAVRDLTLNMYKDQITVLLGHNGAGKTTTMSMLTGMFPPTSGTAIVGGYDIRTDIAGVRQSLGLCPQHNILFDELTVKEHLYFYSRLKGMEKKGVDMEIEKYVQLLELIPKADALSSTLSGGMKRKLSVGVALCGDSKVVMLDEPTAGMDPSARRALWDLLQLQKKDRTILLSTHFMDEADLLGDRIAIMAGGKLQCCGSSFFLKKKYGAGYHLIMDKLPQCDVNEVTALLQKYIPDIEVESNIGSELSYVLNQENATIFEKMLSELELRGNDMGVLSYGISLTTLEEVFMKVGADHGQEEENNEAERGLMANGHERPNAEYQNGLSTKYNNGSMETLESCQFSSEIKLEMGTHLLTGFKLWYNQLKAMFMKRGLSIVRSRLLLFIQILIPVAFLALAIVVIEAPAPFRNLPKRKILLSSYDNPVTVLTRDIKSKYSERYMGALKNDSKALINWENSDMDFKLIDETEKNTTAVRLRYIVGATFYKNKSIIAWFNNHPYHSAPLSLQMIMNTVLQEELSSSNYSIQIYNQPLPYKLNSRIKKLTQGNTTGFQIAFNIGFGMAFVSSFYILFYIKERASKAKHLQFVSGVGVGSFWIPSFISDFLTFIFTSICVVLTVLIFQEDGFKTPTELGRLFSTLFFFGFAVLPMMYLASYCFDVPTTGFTKMTLINIFTGCAAFMIVQVLRVPELQLEYVADILHWIFLIVPHYGLSSGVQNINMLYTVHKVCDAVLDSCMHPSIPGFPNITIPEVLCKKLVCLGEKQCCSTSRNYYNLEKSGIGRNVLFQSCLGVFLIGVLLLVEYRVFEHILNVFQKTHTTPLVTLSPDEDSDVLQEKQKIRNLTAEEINNCNLVMRDVTKYYRNFLAVNNICLGVNRYECFGLLGVNGAGKTTTFKMMTGDIKLSSGDAWVNGQSLKTDMKKIHQLIGYCPQFDALLDDLTCRETLIIFGLLRGITKSESRIMAEKLAYQFDFHRHLDKQVRELSGGNKRKLSTAIALIGDPLVIYLDEPTTGMDPATKRYLWNALCKVRDSGKCIVLTSHSMEECEALCTRLAIMVNGTFKCLGSTQRLKSKFSEGYTLTVKVRRSADHDLESHETEPIENFVKSNFASAILREKHQELLTFYIPDKSQPWSKMFGIMEQGKKSLNVEDYSLGQSSLEQVFLTFTKHQQDS